MVDSAREKCGLCRLLAGGGGGGKWHVDPYKINLLLRPPHPTHTPPSPPSLFRGGGGGRVERRCWINLQCRGVLQVWTIEGQRPIALALGAGGGCLDIFSLVYLFSFLSPSLWETARYREILSQRAVKPKTTNQRLFLRLSAHQHWQIFYDSGILRQDYGIMRCLPMNHTRFAYGVTHLRNRRA